MSDFRRLRTVTATRYVTPLREGGSLPAIVEADDLGLYVLKFRGAGQGPLALVAELIAGEIGRALGLTVPELVFVEVDAALARTEGDPEIRDLILRSTGLNLALDYLPGSIMFDPSASDPVDPLVASAAVWFDSFVTNVDRTARNPNLLYWHRVLYFIDHGAALYFHHDWNDVKSKARTRFPAIQDHVLLGWASELESVGALMGTRISAARVAEVLDEIPDEWLESPEGAGARRAGYLEYFTERLAAAPLFLEEAQNARARLV